MRLDTWLAVILISLSAAFAISGKYQRSKLLHYAFKPLTMLMIISWPGSGRLGILRPTAISSWRASVSLFSGMFF